MTSRASSFVDINESDFGDAKSQESKRLTVQSFDGNTMMLTAEPHEPRPGQGPFSVYISKWDNQFSFSSDFSPQDSVQRLRSMWSTSAQGGTDFVLKAQSALQSALVEESARKWQQQETERQTICNKVFAAYLQLQVRDELDAAELAIYQRFQRANSGIHVNDINRLAQAVIAEDIQFTTKRRILLVDMVQEEKAKGKTA